MISYEAIGQECVTFHTNTVLKAGTPCKMGYNDAVIKAQKDDAFFGIVVSQREMLVNVAVRGFVTVKYSGTAPSVGRVGLCAAGDGSVTASESAPMYQVVNVDVVNKSITFLL